MLYILVCYMHYNIIVETFRLEASVGSVRSDTD